MGKKKNIKNEIRTLVHMIARGETLGCNCSTLRTELHQHSLTMRARERNDATRQLKRQVSTTTEADL